MSNEPRTGWSGRSTVGASEPGAAESLPAQRGGPEHPSYRDHPYWLQYQRFFPGGLRTTGDNEPHEQWWPWRGMAVHLDRIVRPDARARVVFLHDMAMHGRIFAPYGRLPALSDMDFLAPDLPGFGLTSTARRNVTYGTWVQCVLDLLEVEQQTDQRPIVLMGAGVGGRVAYDVAALAPDRLSGVVTTCLVDPRRGEVRRRMAARPELGPWADALSLVPSPLRSVRLPVGWLSNLAAVSNHAQLTNLVWMDPLCNEMSLSFVHTFLSYVPVEPEEFTGPPLLLAHPADDRWMPPSLSRVFFERLAVVKRFVLLSGAGHLPVEESGLSDLDGALRDFLDELGLG